MAIKLGPLGAAALLAAATGAVAADTTTIEQDVARARRLAGSQFADSLFLCENSMRIVDAMRRRVLELDRGALVRDQERGVYGVSR